MKSPGRLAVVAALLASTAAAEEAPPTPEAAPSDTEIEAALARDAAAAPQSSAPATPAPGGQSSPSMNPDLALVLDVAAGAFEGDRLQLGEHDPSRNGASLQQLELTAGSAVDPYFRLDAHLAFGEGGVDLEEAYGTTLDLPLRLQARFGLFLHRFGRTNPTHPHAWAFVDQPLLLGRLFGGEGGRGLGAELSWLTPLPWYVELVATAQHAGGGETARSFLGDDGREIDGPADLLYVAAVKQFFPFGDDLSLAWGLSGAFGPSALESAARTEIYGTDLYLKYRPVASPVPPVLSLTTEWAYRRRRSSVIAQDVTSDTELFYRFAERWGVAARHEYGSPTVTPSGTVVEDPVDPDFTGSVHRIAANVTFWPTEFSRLRLQGSRLFLPGGRSGHALFFAVELAAGAHGAHGY